MGGLVPDTHEQTVSLNSAECTNTPPKLSCAGVGRYPSFATGMSSPAATRLTDSRCMMVRTASATGAPEDVACCADRGEAASPISSATENPRIIPPGRPSCGQCRIGTAWRKDGPRRLEDCHLSLMCRALNCFSNQ